MMCEKIQAEEDAMVLKIQEQAKEINELKRELSLVSNRRDLLLEENEKLVGMLKRAQDWLVGINLPSANKLAFGIGDLIEKGRGLTEEEQAKAALVTEMMGPRVPAPDKAIPGRMSLEERDKAYQWLMEQYGEAIQKMNDVSELTFEEILKLLEEK